MAAAPSRYFDANAAMPVTAAAWAAYRAVAEAPASAADGHVALQQIAASLGVDVACLVPCSGGTEADGLALWGILGGRRGGRVVTTQIEHAAVTATLALLAQQLDFDCVAVAPGPSGRIEPAVLAAVLTPATRLVSMAAACSETGILQPVAAVAALCRQRQIPLHVDAVQALGRLPLPADLWGADLLSFSGHKLGAVGGTGLLVLRPGCPFVHPWPAADDDGEPPDWPGWASLAPALAAAQARARAPSAAGAWRDRFEAGLRRALPTVAILGAEVPRLPSTSCFRLPGCPGDGLLMGLDVRGFAVSTGSACSSGAITASRSLLSMGLSTDAAREAVRVSFHADHTAAAVDGLVAALVDLERLIRTGVGL